MSALTAAAHDEDGDTIARLLLENLDLRARLLECQDAVIRWAARAEKAEDRLAAPQPQRKPLTPDQFTEIAHRTASKYAHRTDPTFISFTFMPNTLEQFVRAVERAHRIGP